MNTFTAAQPLNHSKITTSLSKHLLESILGQAIKSFFYSQPYVGCYVGSGSSRADNVSANSFNSRTALDKVTFC